MRGRARIAGFLPDSPMMTRSLTSRMMNLSLVALAAATMLAALARFGWVAELATHFRLQYALALLVLAAAYLVGRQRRLALVALALLATNAWYLVPYLLPAVITESVAAPAGSDVEVVSLNLLVRNDDYEEVRRYLQQRDADVLVLSELTPKWVEALAPVIAGYPHRLAKARKGAWGLGVYSRYPLVDAEITNLGVTDSSHVAATLRLPGGDVQLLGVHLVSPTLPGRAERRNRQLVALANRLGPPRSPAEPRMPRLLLGDMNVTPFSPYFRELLERTGLQDQRGAAGLIGTWPTWVLPLQIPIDHCIADPDLGVTRVARGPIVGSDHYPLEITLRQRG
jgi:endonuclease/exonuclease/phosphatase (EEP) superfamily protein YafD